MAGRVSFMGGEMEAGYIPAFVEARVIGVTQQEQKTYEGGRKSEPAFDVVLSTDFESFTAVYYGEKLPSPLDRRKDYLFVLGIRNDSFGQATQPKVRIINYRPGTLLTDAFEGKFEAAPAATTPTPSPVASGAFPPVPGAK